MHACLAHRCAPRRVVLPLAAALSLLVLPAARAEIRLNQLKVGADVYRNVTVTGSNKTDVFLTHSRGMVNLKIERLSPETRWRLGLGPKPGSPEALAAEAAAAAASTKSSGFLARWFGPSKKKVTTEPVPAPATGPAAGPAAAPVDQPERAESWSAAFRINPMQSVGDRMAAVATSGSGLLLILGLILGIYWFACYCLKRIVRKAGYAPNFGIWIPILNALHALRAARMSDAWLAVPFIMIILGEVAFAGALANKAAAGLWLRAYVLLLGLGVVIAFIGQMVWCVRIVGARGKGYWLSLFMILALLCPLAAPMSMISEQLFRVCWFGANALGIFAFLYLAFSSEGDGMKDDADDEKIVISTVLTEA